MRSFFVCVVLLIATSISLAQNAIDAQDWSLPLFLWQTTQDSTTYHTALLPKAPSAYLSSTGANYTLVFEEPVAFAFELDDNASEILSYPLVTLKLYYSASRADFQTTTRSLSELNTHGGTYEYITTIGAAASTPGQGFAAASFVPLLVSYDDDAADSATAPLSFQDLNLLLSSSDLERKYVIEYSLLFNRLFLCGLDLMCIVLRGSLQSEILLYPYPVLYSIPHKHHPNKDYSFNHILLLYQVSPGILGGSRRARTR